MYKQMEGLRILRYVRMFHKTLVGHSGICQTVRPISYLQYHNSLPPVVVLKQILTFSPFHNQVQNYAKKVGKKGGKQKIMQLSEEEMSDVINVEGYKRDLVEIKENLIKNFVENLSLRSAAGNVGNLIVKIEDEEYPLQELAQISRKNQNLIAINMSDFPEGLKPAIKAITASGSGMNPQQEGTMIYLNIPKLTREHREKLSKNAKVLFTKAKDEVRTVQNYYIKEAKKREDLSEDLIFSSCNQIMTMAENTNADLEKSFKTKQTELLGDD